jgi:hypothetical protein
MNIYDLLQSNSGVNITIDAGQLIDTLKTYQSITRINHALLIGTPTFGSTGAPLIRLLSDKVYYRICTRVPLNVCKRFQ